MKVTAHATRSGDWWAVEVPEVDGVFTQAKRLDQVASEVADAVGLLEDVDPATVEVEVIARLGTADDTAVAALRLERDRLEAEQLALAADARLIAASLVRKAGLSLRDAGQMLGISHQRVAQLLETASASKPKTVGGVRVVTKSDKRSKSRSASSGRFVTKGAAASAGRSAAKRVSASPKQAAAKTTRHVHG